MRSIQTKNIKSIFLYFLDKTSYTLSFTRCLIGISGIIFNSFIQIQKKDFNIEIINDLLKFYLSLSVNRNEIVRTLAIQYTVILINEFSIIKYNISNIITLLEIINVLNEKYKEIIISPSISYTKINISTLPNPIDIPCNRDCIKIVMLQLEVIYNKWISESIQRHSDKMVILLHSIQININNKTDIFLNQRNLSVLITTILNNQTIFPFSTSVISLNNKTLNYKLNEYELQNYYMGYINSKLEIIRNEMNKSDFESIQILTDNIYKQYEILISKYNSYLIEIKQKQNNDENDNILSNIQEEYSNIIYSSTVISILLSNKYNKYNDKLLYIISYLPIIIWNENTMKIACFNWNWFMNITTNGSIMMKLWDYLFNSLIYTKYNKYGMFYEKPLKEQYFEWINCKNGDNLMFSPPQNNYYIYSNDNNNINKGNETFNQSEPHKIMLEFIMMNIQSSIYSSPLLIQNYTVLLHELITDKISINMNNFISFECQLLMIEMIIQIILSQKQPYSLNYFLISKVFLFTLNILSFPMIQYPSHSDYKCLELINTLIKTINYYEEIVYIYYFILFFIRKLGLLFFQLIFLLFIQSDILIYLLLGI